MSLLDVASSVSVILSGCADDSALQSAYQCILPVLARDPLSIVQTILNHHNNNRHHYHHAIHAIQWIICNIPSAIITTIPYINNKSLLILYRYIAFILTKHRHEVIQDTPTILELATLLQSSIKSKTGSSAPTVLQIAAFDAFLAVLVTRFSALAQHESTKQTLKILSVWFSESKPLLCSAMPLYIRLLNESSSELLKEPLELLFQQRNWTFSEEPSEIWRRLSTPDFRNEETNFALNLVAFSWSVSRGQSISKPTLSLSQALFRSSWISCWSQEACHLQAQVWIALFQRNLWRNVSRGNSKELFDALHRLSEDVRKSICHSCPSKVILRELGKAGKNHFEAERRITTPRDLLQL